MLLQLPLLPPPPSVATAVTARGDIATAMVGLQLRQNHHQQTSLPRLPPFPCDQSKPNHHQPTASPLPPHGDPASKQATGYPESKSPKTPPPPPHTRAHPLPLRKYSIKTTTPRVSPPEVLDFKTRKKNPPTSPLPPLRNLSVETIVGTHAPPIGQHQHQHPVTNNDCGRDLQ